jgi:iron(III) transport system ATP-binding protein
MQVGVKDLTKSFDSVDGRANALRGITFQVQPGEFYTLLGPSGCGKSTTLRCVAGLERPDSGEIAIGAKIVADARVFESPDKRPIGMVFQSYAIWPHMTVFKNVVFPLKQQKIPRQQREKLVMEALSLVKMEELAHRPAPYLSGGQQQRVALARALVSKPQVLLLDEPLSNLDAKLREELRFEIKELTRRLGITTLYVTHDQAEALAMSDRIAVMLNGQILQEATPKELYLKPAAKFVAQFIGQVNFFEGTVAESSGNGMGLVRTARGELRCYIPSSIAKGAQALVSVRPESFQIVRERPRIECNVLEGTIDKFVFLGDFIDCQVLMDDQPVRVKVPATSDLNQGERVFLEFDPRACILLPVPAN